MVLHGCAAGCQTHRPWRTPTFELARSHKEASVVLRDCPVRAQALTCPGACRNEITHSHKEKTVVLQDVTADPTLPRTRDVTCAKCGHNEAVFFSAATEEVRMRCVPLDWQSSTAECRAAVEQSWSGWRCLSAVTVQELSCVLMKGGRSLLLCG